MPRTSTLFRPVGPIELKRILESGSTRFPPRLPDQPIFYPVLNFPYAEQIARDWNATRGNHAGFVTRFEVDATYLARFREQVVGAQDVHRELWVPAEELEDFNRHVQPPIEVLSAYYGPAYQGPPAEHGLLRGLRAVEQMQMLEQLAESPDFEGEVTANRTVLQVNLLWWSRQPGLSPVLERLLPLWPSEWREARDHRG